jgi:hypothetical protein
MEAAGIEPAQDFNRMQLERNGCHATPSQEPVSWAS